MALFDSDLGAWFLGFSWSRSTVWRGFGMCLGPLVYLAYDIGSLRECNSDRSCSENELILKIKLQLQFERVQAAVAYYRQLEADTDQVFLASTRLRNRDPRVGDVLALLEKFALLLGM